MDFRLLSQLEWGEPLGNFSKADYLAGPLAAQQAFGRLDEIVENLARRGEYITLSEWTCEKYGKDQRECLMDIAIKHGVAAEFYNSYICTERTKKQLPPPPRFIAPEKHAHTEAASPDFDKLFWKKCREGDTSVALGLWRKADINIEYKKSIDESPTVYTPLQIAAKEGHTRVVEFLVSVGADPDERIRRGMEKTALMLAGWCGNKHTVIGLLDALEHRWGHDPEKLYASLLWKDDEGAWARGYVSIFCGEEIAHYLDELVARTQARIPTTVIDESVRALRRAIEAGLLPQALGAFAATGGKLSLELLSKREPGAYNSNLEEMAIRGQMAALLNPDYWVGNVRDMRECWRRVPEKYRGQMDGKDDRPDFNVMVQAAMRESVRTGRRGGKGRE